MKTISVNITFDDSTMTELDICSGIRGVVTHVQPLSKMSKFKLVWQTLQSGKLTDAINLYKSTYDEPIQNNTAKSYLNELVHQNFLVRHIRGYYKLSTFDGPVEVHAGESCIDKMRRLFDVTPQLNFSDVGTWYKMIYGEDVPTATLTANLRTLVDRGDLIRPVRGVYHHPDASFNPVQATPVSDCDRVAELMEGFGMAGINRLVMEFPKVYGRKISTASVRNYVVKLHKGGKVERVRPGVYQWKGDEG